MNHPASIASLNHHSSKKTTSKNTSNNMKKETNTNSSMVVMSFPEKLHNLLEANKASDSMRWTSKGDAVCLFQESFERSASLKHFQGIRFLSLTRRLQRNGFQRVFRPDEGCNQVYQHVMFCRGGAHLLSFFRLDTKKQRELLQTSSPRGAVAMVGSVTNSPASSQPPEPLSMPFSGAKKDPQRQGRAHQSPAARPRSQIRASLPELLPLLEQQQQQKQVSSMPLLPAMVAASSAPMGATPSSSSLYHVLLDNMLRRIHHQQVEQWQRQSLLASAPSSVHGGADENSRERLLLLLHHHQQQQGWTQEGL